MTRIHKEPERINPSALQALPRLTPTQDLVMEVLSARDRLDDRWWPFPTRLRAVLEGLERLGLIQTMSGIVQGTIRADITDAGRAMYQREPYGPQHRSEQC